MNKIIILLYVLTTAAALVLLKLGTVSGAPVALQEGRLSFNINPTIVIAGILYVSSFILYTYLISKYDLGYIIPLGTGLVYVIIFFASFTIFKENFTAFKILGIVLIFAGVTLLNFKR